MRAVDIIQHKRDGNELSKDEIEFMCRGTTDHSVSDEQIAAFLMAVYFRGMSDAETRYLTDAMTHSGDVVDLSDLPGQTVDKHSTGGVGDTTTLILAPVLATCGTLVAKMSGRGLGHTGGTLDKLESIPGLHTRLTLERFKDQVRRIGVAVISQTGNLVPTDARWYSIRDVTATIDSIPLIAASIMSKKLAAGSQCICLDVKFGNGAFMKTLEEARELARMMVSIGVGLGRCVRAVITSMDAPLATHIGNALEVREALSILRGEGEHTPLRHVVVELAGHLLEMAGVCRRAEAHDRVVRVLTNGDALARFRAMVEAQGGDIKCVDDPSRLPQAAQVVTVTAAQGGYVQSLNALMVGKASVLLGAGRARKSDPIDPAVGIVLQARAGNPVSPGAPLAHLHVNDTTHLARAQAMVQEAFRIGSQAPEEEPVIADLVGE